MTRTLAVADRADRQPPRARPRLRLLVIAVVVLVTACHRPTLRDRARRVGAGFAALGGRVVAVVQPPNASIDVRAVAAAGVRQVAHAGVDRAVDHAVGHAVDHASVHREPRTLPQSPGVRDPGGGAAPVAHREDPAPPVTVTRVDAARPTVFVLRSQTHAGKSMCETYTTKDECVSTCTSKLRMNAFTKPTPTTVTSCSCLEQDGGC